MNNWFESIASATKRVRLQRNVGQETAANESAISLRTIQNIEAGKAVNSSSLFSYLAYLDLLENMLATLPDPNKLTPVEQLSATPRRRKRARKNKKAIDPKPLPTPGGEKFIWGDEK